MMALAPGLAVPAIGQGTWHMGERRDRHAAEVAALRHGLALGLSLIDTAEIYADGGAERVVAEAIAGKRDKVVLVSKVAPHNATRAGTIAACERSLERLGTDYIDVYLLHWAGGVPFAETAEAFERLKQDGKIRHGGVSNLDTAEMADWEKAGGQAATNQILYNLFRRGPEFDLIRWCRRRSISIMAYSPVEQGRLLTDPALSAVAARRNVSPAEVALAWLVQREGVVAIPKAAARAHIDANRRALDLVLEAEDLADLDRGFPPPLRKSPLAML